MDREYEKIVSEVDGFEFGFLYTKALENLDELVYPLLQTGAYSGMESSGIAEYDGLLAPGVFPR